MRLALSAFVMVVLIDGVAINDVHAREGRSAASCEKKKTSKPAATSPSGKKKKKGPEVVPSKKGEPDPEEPADSAAPAGDGGEEIQRGERVEFDARLIQGQTAKAGAVYLFERASSNLRSMVRQRAAMREKIVQSIYRPNEGDQVSDNVEPTKPKKSDKSERAEKAEKAVDAEAKP